MQRSNSHVRQNGHSSRSSGSFHSNNTDHRSRRKSLCVLPRSIPKLVQYARWFHEDIIYLVLAETRLRSDIRIRHEVNPSDMPLQLCGIVDADILVVTMDAPKIVLWRVIPSFTLSVHPSRDIRLDMADRAFFNLMFDIGTIADAWIACGMRIRYRYHKRK